MSCSTEEQWLEVLLDGTLDESRLLHVAECPECERLVGELREMTGRLESFAVAEPPPEVLREALGLMQRPSWMARAVEVVRAALVVDSATLAPAAVRRARSSNAADSPRKHYLRFETEGRVAELYTVQQREGSAELSGRLTPSEDQAPFTVIAHPERGPEQLQLSDLQGRFYFPALPADAYQLRIELDDRDLVLAPVDLSDPEPGSAAPRSKRDPRR